MVTPISNKNFASLCQLLQRPELLQDPRFVFGPRSRHFKELAAEIEKWSQSLSTEEVENALNAAGVPCSAYTQLDELFSHPQVVERQSFSPVSNDQLGEFLIQCIPVKFQHMNNRTASWAAPSSAFTPVKAMSTLSLRMTWSSVSGVTTQPPQLPLPVLTSGRAAKGKMKVKVTEWGWMMVWFIN